MAQRDPATAALLIRGTDGSAASNPLVCIARSAADAMMRFAGELGMTPIARTRLAGGRFTLPTGGKFDGLLG
jgi:phage terminase small subunit